MTPDQRFAITILLLSTLIAVMGWAVRVGLKTLRDSSRRAQLIDDEIASLRRHDLANRTQVDELAKKLAEAITRLTDLYVDMNERQARQEGRTEYLVQSMHALRNE